MMKPFKGVVGITGLNATDNPGPGVSVSRSLRLEPSFQGKIIGLVYDTLEPGIYAQDIFDAVFLIPLPTEGKDALLSRLRYIKGRIGLDVVIPTLDAELPSFIALERELQDAGIASFLPTRWQYDIRSKIKLYDTGLKYNVPVPLTRPLIDVDSVYDLSNHMSYPLVIKGLFYGAKVVYTLDAALAEFHKIAATWGLPALAQEYHQGQEFDVVAVGDGEGGLIGAVPMRKTMLTDKGKGWAGVAVRDKALLDITNRVMSALKWRGPCEIEILKAEKDGTYLLLEINPRFPAWTFLSAGAGHNLPFATVQAAIGETPALPEFKSGTMFVRISIDQVAHISQFEQITTTGEILFTEDNVTEPENEHNGADNE